MSGVYIKGIKLPTIHEGQMVIRIDPDGKADVQWSGMVGGEYTKAVEVPDHGRLVDADALKKTEVPFWAVSTLLGRNSRIVLPSAIAKVTTVIEADRSE